MSGDRADGPSRVITRVCGSWQTPCRATDCDHDGRTRARARGGSSMSMSVRRSTLSGTSTWQRRAVVLVTALASALGVAVVAGPAADAAKPTPPPATAQLQFTKVLDNGFIL